MPTKRLCVGQRVTIEWGRCKGREGVVTDVSVVCAGMVTVEFEARAADPAAGVEVGDTVTVFLHWTQVEPLTRPTRRP